MGCCDQNTGTPAGLLADCCADWDLELGRYFFIDPVAGSDANIGYIDAALGSTFTPAQVTAVAKASFAGFREAFPASGNNRVAILLILPGNVGPMDFRGIGGYKQFIRRGSDGSNSVTDKSTCGYVTAYGPFTVDVGATTSNIPTVEALPAGVLPYGLRIRFTSGALSGSFAVYNRTTGNAAVPESNLSSAPVAGVTYVIERPGAVGTEYWELTQNNFLTFPTNVLGTLVTAGIGIQTITGRTVNQGCEGSPASYSGFEQIGQSGNTTPINVGYAGIRVSASYVDETGTSRNVGMTARYEDSVDWRLCTGSVSVSSLYAVGTWVSSKGNRFGGGQFLFCSDSGYFAMGATITNPIDGGGEVTNKVFGHVSATKRPVYIGGVSPFVTQLAGLRVDTSIALLGIDFSNIGAFPCVRIVGDGHVVAIDDLFSSVGGNTDVAVDLTSASNVKLRCFSGNTLSPALGQIRLVGPAITTYAGLVLSNVVDAQRNNVYGLIADGFAGQVVDVCKQVVNDNGNALAIGQVVQGNGTTNQVESAVNSILGVMVTPPADGAIGYMACAGTPYCLFTEAPTPGAMAMLSETSGQLTTRKIGTIVAGRCINDVTAEGRIAWHPDNTYIPQLEPATGLYLRDPMLTTVDQFNLDHSLLQVWRGNSAGLSALEDTTGQHQGIRRNTISALNGSYIWVTASDNSTFSIPPAAAGFLRVRYIYKIPVLSTGSNRFTHRAGVSRGSSNPNLATGLVTCKYVDNEAGGNFQLEAYDGTPVALVNSGVNVVADTWYFVTLELTQESCRLYIDTDPRNKTLRATVNTDIPTGLVRSSYNCFLTVYDGAGNEGISDYDDFTIEQVLIPA